MVATRVRFPLLLLLVLLTGGCPKEDPASEGQEILITEDVGGAIDAGLTTDDDPRGRRRAESGQVLPPGFPAELPLPVGVSVVESAPSGAGRNVVVLDAAASAETLAADWQSLLETEGWIVTRANAQALSARRGEQEVSAVISPSGSGSRLRIVY